MRAVVVLLVVLLVVRLVLLSIPSESLEVVWYVVC